MKRLLLATVAAVGAMAALPAAAQFQKPEDAIKYRQSAFTVMGNHVGRIGAMASGRAPFDAKVVADNIAIAATMSTLPFAGFGPGTDKGETKAKPEIWAEMDKFRAGAKKMQDEMVKLSTVAKGGNIDTIKAAAGEVGKLCKACHDDFRKE